MSTDSIIFLQVFFISGCHKSYISISQINYIERAKQHQTSKSSLKSFPEVLSNSHLHMVLCACHWVYDHSEKYVVLKPPSKWHKLAHHLIKQSLTIGIKQISRTRHITHTRILGWNPQYFFAVTLCIYPDVISKRKKEKKSHD